MMSVALRWSTLSVIDREKGHGEALYSLLIFALKLSGQILSPLILFVSDSKSVSHPLILERALCVHSAPGKGELADTGSTGNAWTRLLLTSCELLMFLISVTPFFVVIKHLLIPELPPKSSSLDWQTDGMRGHISRCENFVSISQLLCVDPLHRCTAFAPCSSSSSSSSLFFHIVLYKILQPSLDFLPLYFSCTMHIL